jgi:hypothetical protein
MCERRIVFFARAFFSCKLSRPCLPLLCQDAENMNPRTIKSLGIVSLLLVVCLCLLATQGCGTNQTGDITGNVICGGVPVLMGEVFLQDQDGHSFSGFIDSGGHFTILQAPVGMMQVAVTGRIQPPVGERKAIFKRLYKLMEEAKAKAEKAGKKFSPADFDDPDTVPNKYSATKTSGLTYEVKPGHQNLDLNLEGVPKE